MYINYIIDSKKFIKFMELNTDFNSFGKIANVTNKKRQYIHDIVCNSSPIRAKTKEVLINKLKINDDFFIIVHKGKTDIKEPEKTIVMNKKNIIEMFKYLKLNYSGKLPKRLKLVSIELNPTKVRALYPVSEKQQNEITVTTTPLYLESINETTSLLCKIIAPPSIQPLDRRWPDVEVKITVSSLQ